MRVLETGAHPDEIELLSGGRMAKYAKKDHTVITAGMTNGDKGHPKTPPEKLDKIKSARRHSETWKNQWIWGHT